MREILDFVETPYVDAQTLLVHLTGYRNPRDWIARMVKKGELLRLRNGFFLIAARFRRGEAVYPYEQIANLLYGPSYISLEWALSYYGLIPERVSIVTSVTTGKHKEFATPLGHFAYHHLSLDRYRVGIGRREIEGQLGGFLIATPEKALSDWVFLTSRGLKEDELFEDLIEGKRIEKENLQSLDKKLLREIKNSYSSSAVDALLNIVEKI